MAHEYGQYAHATQLPDEPGLVFRGGVIRFDTNTPKLHINSSHQSVGILPDSLKITGSGDLEFVLDTSLPVVSLWANADETLVAKNIQAGISGGGTRCVVRFNRTDMDVGEKLNLNWVGHYGRVKDTYANLWVGVVSYYEGE